jgi:acyl carrier protein
MSIVDTLQDVFRDVFDNSSIDLSTDTGPDDIEGWDSLAQVKLILMIQDEFGIQLESEEAGEMQTVGNMITILEKHVD